MMDIPPEQPVNDPGSAFMHPPSDDRDLFGNPPKHHADWAHRRGEPRVFTLLWMVYLMGATVLMFSSMAMAYSISPEITRPAARSMLLVVMIGFSVLWPMVRFSQAALPFGDTEHVRFAIRDALVIFVPLQAVLWPQALPVLAGWPISVVAAISAFCFAWITILAGVVALGSASIERNGSKDTPRILWMLIVILIVFGAPIIASLQLSLRPDLAMVGVDRPRVGWLLSPVSGFLEIVRDRRELGTAARVFHEQWRMIIALFFAGSALLLITRVLEVARGRFRA
jgi:hypothetical protein